MQSEIPVIITSMISHEKSTRVSIACAAILLPATILFSKVVEYILKSTNPSNVNIYHELAYLSPILIASIVFYSIIFIIGMTSGIYALKSSSSKFARLSVMLLSVELVMAVASLLLQRATTSL